MRLGFQLLSHRPPDKVFIKLLDKPNELPDRRIVIHHDFSQSEFPKELEDKYGLELIRPSRKTQWGHISKVPAIIDCFYKLLEGDVPDWFFSLSPNCYPVRPWNELIDFLKETPFDTFIECNPLGMEHEGVQQWHFRTLFTKFRFSFPMISRRGKFYWRSFRTPINIEHTPFASGYRAYTGSDWFALNKSAAMKMKTEQLHRHKILDYIAKANLAPDANASPVEIVFQTFYGNISDLNHAYHNLHYINWDESTDWHPNSLTESDLPKIKSSKAFFARKFNSERSMGLIEEISKSNP